MASLSVTVSECLRGSVEALLTLDKEMRPRLVASLQNRGAEASQAEEIAADVLSECARPGESSLLNRFHGNREFESWLLRVAINRLIDRQRRLALYKHESFDHSKHEPASPPLTDSDAALRKIARKALVEAFASCEAQVRVLLWLVYAFNVKQSRMAAAWGWSESRVSRTLTAGGETIRLRTLRAVHQMEPGLTLEWEDIVGVCADDEENLFLGSCKFPN
jgi:RNA polymerase sigma factor (sigma-70 family)